MNFIKKFFVNLDAKRRALNLKAFMRSLGKQSGYALDPKTVHSFFADGRYDVYFTLKEKIAQLERDSERMKNELWDACVDHHIIFKDLTELEIVYVGSRLVFKNVDFYRKEFDLQLKWQGTSWRITDGEKWDTFDFKHCTFVERFEKIKKLEDLNRNGKRDDNVKSDEWWFIVDLNFIAYILRDLHRIIKKWELRKV